MEAVSAVHANTALKIDLVNCWVFMSLSRFVFEVEVKCGNKLNAVALVGGRVE